VPDSHSSKLSGLLPSFSPEMANLSCVSRPVLFASAHTSLLVLWSLVVAHCALLPARAVSPRLTNILPPGAQRGTDIEVRFTGQRLDDTKEIIFYTPGISAVSTEPGTDRVKATLRVAPDCRLGEHQMRLRTATGVSEVRTFWIGALTNVAEAEPNNESAKAQRLALGCTVNGTVTSEDMDFFIVAAEKGQRLTAEIEGMRLGRGVFDPCIAILNHNGKPLAEAEDSALALQDGVASIIAPETGDYIVQVRETAFGGRDDFHYRLHVGGFPRPTGVYPVAGRAGETLKVKFLGDVTGEFDQEIKLPGEPQEKFGVFAGSLSPLGTSGERDGERGRPDKETSSPRPSPPSDGGEEVSPSPNWMRVTSFPTALEAEPNDSREQAGEAREVPVVFNGILSKPADHDWFRFRAKKGQNLQVTVFARRLRSPLDSAIQIVNAKGSPVADNDDAAGPDSLVNFKPDEDGDYTVLVRDHLRRGGADFVYCLEVAPVEPGITVKISEVARNDTQGRQYIAVPRGNRFATLISVRRANVASELTFRADYLPNGVRLLAETLPAKTDQFPLLFEAAADAPVDGRLIDLVATATNGVTGRYRNDISLVEGPNNTSYYGTRLERLLVAVTEAAPFKLRIVEPKVPLVQGGTMDLKIVAERDAGFDEAINLKMVWNPPGVTSQPDITIPKGASDVSFPLSAKTDAELREWKIAVLASTRVKEGDLFISSQLAPLTVGEPFLTAVIEKSACEVGKGTNIVVRLEQKIPFQGEATIKLVGLSDKVSVSEKQITKDDKEVIFPVKVDANCSPGSQRNLFCTVAVKKDGEVIPHNVGQGGSFRVVPPRKPAEEKKVASK
jgi:hypothetical protein